MIGTSVPGILLPCFIQEGVSDSVQERSIGAGETEQGDRSGRSGVSVHRPPFPALLLEHVAQARCGAVDRVLKAADDLGAQDSDCQLGCGYCVDTC
nr:hypothetical protein [Pseudonocardia nigra]